MCYPVSPLVNPERCPTECPSGEPPSSHDLQRPRRELENFLQKPSKCSEGLLGGPSTEEHISIHNKPFPVCEKCFYISSVQFKNNRNFVPCPIAKTFAGSERLLPSDLEMGCHHTSVSRLRRLFKPKEKIFSHRILTNFLILFVLTRASELATLRPGMIRRYRNLTQLTRSFVHFVVSL